MWRAIRAIVAVVLALALGVAVAEALDMRERYIDYTRGPAPVVDESTVFSAVVAYSEACHGHADRHSYMDVDQTDPAYQRAQLRYELDAKGDPAYEIELIPRHDKPLMLTWAYGGAYERGTLHGLMIKFVSDEGVPTRKLNVPVRPDQRQLELPLLKREGFTVGQVGVQPRERVSNVWLCWSDPQGSKS